MRRSILPLWFTTEDREYRRLIAHIGLPSLGFARVAGAMFEPRFRETVFTMVVRKIEANQERVHVTADELQDVFDRLVTQMRILGIDDRERAYVSRGFAAAVDTLTRRLIPSERPAEGLIARADALQAHWKKRGLLSLPPTIDVEARDAVIRKLESKTEFRQRFAHEVETYASQLGQESGRRKDGELNRRHRNRMISYMTQEMARIWP